MCRLAAYLGPETSLQQIIFGTDHSLEKQAWQPQELREAKLNADGFGLGWYNTTGNDASQVARYRQVLPIWSDPNLTDFAQSMQRSIWLCYIRSATPGLGTSLENTQPFFHDEWLFMHNGYIRDFQISIRGKIRQLLHHEIESLIHGTTDSEYLFAMILHFYRTSGDMTAAIRECFKQLAEWLGKERALLNILMSDGAQIISTTHAINGECPTLYYGENITDFPTGSQLIVSERLNNDANWYTIPAHQLIRLRRGEPAEFKDL